MCCFSRPVLSVSSTHLFARGTPDGRQLLAYGMTLSAAEDLAMLLPLPVPEGAPEDAVTFLDLSGYPAFFRDLAKAFPEPVLESMLRSKSLAKSAPKLAVVEVGGFEASFVPTVRDFDRLDARFRLPTEVWSRLPGYDRFGFAVFKLQQGKKEIHPMAFSFPRADAARLFFPTVHIHDGEVHDAADFDHVLFCQRSVGASAELPEGWRSSSNGTWLVDIERARGLVDQDLPLHMLRVRGLRLNSDIYLAD